MPLKIATWNVNSVRMRQQRVRALLERHEPDLLCLQELKVPGDTFPAETFESLGYRSVAFGQAGRNGVGMLSRQPLGDVARGFAGDPAPAQARVLSASLDDLRVVNVYVVNGQFVGSPDYDLKLRWLDALGQWLRATRDASEPLLVVGDFNVAPEDLDVHDPDAWRGRNLCSEPERERIRALMAWGLVDLVRSREPGPGPFTFWDYRAGAFHRGWGLRLDLALGTEPVAARCSGTWVDRDERKPTFGEGKPSDHAPLFVSLT